MQGILCSNPDQSKHLETARMRMFGVWIDFVNLRSETYANHSRIPEAVRLILFVMLNVSRSGLNIRKGLQIHVF